MVFNKTAAFYHLKTRHKKWSKNDHLNTGRSGIQMFTVDDHFRCEQSIFCMKWSRLADHLKTGPTFERLQTRQMTIGRRDIQVWFLNGILAQTILCMKRVIKTFLFHKKLSSGPFENWTGNRMVKDHIELFTS